MFMNSMLENKNVLITGGAGFIGSNLIDRLLTQNNNVVCLDNFSTGKRSNIKPFLENPSFKLVEGDIRNREDCDKAAKGCQVVLHQAALGSVPRSIVDPKTTNDVNISGFVNVLLAARDAGIKRIVYAASSSTYGDSESMPKVEDVIGRPLSPYAVTKFVNELYADVFAKLYDLELVGLRYFNVFGMRQDPDGAYAAVIPKFVKSLISHEAPTINGDGSFSRDFTFIDNVVQANQRAAIVENKSAVNTVYNVAFGERTSLKELINYLKEFLSPYDKAINDIEINYGPERIGDIPHSLASIEKAKSLLGYSPQYSVKEGLKKAIDWYWTNLSNK